MGRMGNGPPKTSVGWATMHLAQASSVKLFLANIRSNNGLLLILPADRSFAGVS